MRAEAHLVDVVAIRVAAHVVGAETADATLRRLVERRDAGDDRQLAGMVFNGAELRAERLDRFAELLVGRLKLAIFVLELIQLVGLRKGGEVLEREECREAEGRRDEGDDREEEAMRHFQLPEFGPRVRDKNDR